MKILKFILSLFKKKPYVRPIKEGPIYYCKFIAFDKNGQEMAPSDEMIFTEHPGKMNVSYKSVDGAIDYKIYRT